MSEFGLKLHTRLKLSTQLVMTPQLQQAIKTLQMTHLELCQEIKQQTYENPCLEEVDAGQDELEALQNFVSSVWENQAGSRHQEFEPFSDEGPQYERYLSKAESLSEYLMWQVRNSAFSPLEVQIAESISGNLDDRGYLALKVESIAKERGVFVSQVERVLIQVQQLDPVGVASRTLQECLLNQLWSFEVKTTVVKRAIEIIDAFFSLFLKRDLLAICRKLGCEFLDAKSAFDLIVQLNPKPGRDFSKDVSDIVHIRPDVFIKKEYQGFRIQVNDSGLPRLKVSRVYLDVLARKGDKRDIEYIKDRIRQAIWFIKSIEQRHSTLFKVSNSILKLQRTFFEKGSKYLKPMVLRDVADDIEMHISTISRVTRGKYMETPFGVVELKYFFNTGTENQENALASRSIKERIRQLVAREDARCPLSDQKICDLLAEEQIEVARRTVAKYREQLQILSSSARRKKF